MAELAVTPPDLVHAAMPLATAATAAPDTTGEDPADAPIIVARAIADLDPGDASAALLPILHAIMTTGPGGCGEAKMLGVGSLFAQDTLAEFARLRGGGAADHHSARN